MRQRIINRVLPIAILVVVFITAISLGIMQVHASEGFTDNSEVWHNTNNSISASQTGTYPYNTDSSKVSVKCVPLDILFGTTKGWGLTQYHGEVPYVQTYNEKDDKTANGFGKKPVRPDTTIASGSANNNPGGVSAKDYWGFDSDTDLTIGSDSKKMSSDAASAKLNEYEKINNAEVVSLRLYALANTSKTQFFSNLLYTIGVGLAGAATFILGLIVDAKNIDMEEIMNMLNLQEISKVMTSSFIFNSDSSALSPFAVFALVMFIFALVAYTIRYVKGNDKTTGLKDILATALIGALVIGICLTGRVVSLGSTAADFANQLMATMAGISSNSNGNAFVIQVTDKDHSNKVAQLAETTLINKTFIDMQICTQFGVSSVTDLNFEKLGDTNGSIAKDGMFNQYLDGADIMTDFNGNLGYYYWFANSSAEKKTSMNAKYPKSNSLAIEGKLDSIITYLQKVYNQNKASGKTAENEKIKQIILSLAKPNGATGFVSMLLLAVLLAITGICIFRYCLNVMIAKLELFLAILGLAVAGPLMLTSNKKLVGTGKVIVGMIPVAFIEITVYSIIFDVILFLISSLMSTEVYKMLILIALVILLMKLNPIIQEKIRQLLNTATRTISPALANARRSIKTYTQRKANDIMSRYDKSRKVIGHDKDGKAILEEREGNALSKLMHQGYNAMYNDGLNREGFGKINKKSKEARDRNTARSAEELRRDAEARVGEVMANIKNEASALENEVLVEEKNYKDQRYTINGNETIYNAENLTDAEKAKANEIGAIRAEIDAISKSAAFTRLAMLEKSNNGQLSDQDKSELDKLRNELNAKIDQVSKKDEDLRRSINNDAKEFAFAKKGLDSDVEGDTDKDKLRNATMKKAQDNNADKLQRALEDGINTVKDEVNTKKSTKIGSSNETVNRQALTSSAAMMHQLNQLKNDALVSDMNTAKEEVKDAVDMVAQHNDKNAGSNLVENAEKNYKESKRIFNTGLSKEERKENKANAKANLKDAKREVAENEREGKENYRESVEKYGRNISSVGPVNLDISKSTIAEQLATAVKDKTPAKKSNDLAKATLTKASLEKPNADISTSTENTTSNESKQTIEDATKNKLNEQIAKEKVTDLSKKNNTSQDAAQSNQTQQKTQEVQPQPQAQVQPQPQAQEAKPQNTSNNTQQPQKSNSLEKMAKEKESTNTTSNNTNNVQQNNQQTTSQQNNTNQNDQSSKKNIKLDVPTKDSKPQSNAKPEPAKPQPSKSNNNESNNIQPQPTSKPEKPESKVDIEDVKPITRTQSDYLKDEGREYLAREEAAAKDSGGDFWAKRKK